MGRHPLYNLIVISFRYTGGRSSEQLYARKNWHLPESRWLRWWTCSRAHNIESQIIQWKFNGVKIERKQLDNCFRIIFYLVLFGTIAIWANVCQKSKCSSWWWWSALCASHCTDVLFSAGRSGQSLRWVLANDENHFNFTVHNSIRGNKRMRSNENEKQNEIEVRNKVAIPTRTLVVRSIKHQWIDECFCGDEGKFSRRC